MKKKEQAHNPKTIVYTKLFIGILLSITLILWAIGHGIKNNSIIAASLMVLVALAIAILFISYTIRELKSVSKGLPVEDERSKKVLNLSFARAYAISIWLLLILSFLSSDGYIIFRDASQALNIGILGMVILFGLCWLYYNSRPEA